MSQEHQNANTPAAALAGKVIAKLRLLTIARPPYKLTDEELKEIIAAIGALGQEHGKMHDFLKRLTDREDEDYECPRCYPDSSCDDWHTCNSCNAEIGIHDSAAITEAREYLDDLTPEEPTETNQ